MNYEEEAEKLWEKFTQKYNRMAEFPKLTKEREGIKKDTLELADQLKLTPNMFNTILKYMDETMEEYL